MPEAKNATHKALVLGLALVTACHESLVLFFYPIMNCGGHLVAMTVLPRDQRKQHGPFYPGRRLSQYVVTLFFTHHSDVWWTTPLKGLVQGPH